MTKQLTTVFTEIQKRLVDSTYRFPKGGAATRIISVFLDQLEKEFGTVTSERLVDVCVTIAYTYRERTKWSLKQAFTPAAIKKMKESKRGVLFYQNQWLESKSLSRNSLLRLIKDRKEHPQAKFIYIQAEEATKRRQLNRKTGFLLCQLSTLGWSPLSEMCGQCNFVEDCKRETERKYPEIFRLRIEHGNSNK